MYRGVSLSVTRYAASFVILRFVKDSAFAPVLLVFPGHTTNTPHFVATGIAAYAAHYILYPLDVLRCVVALVRWEIVCHIVALAGRTLPLGTTLQRTDRSARL
jgi:hypothetical protein